MMEIDGVNKLVLLDCLMPSEPGNNHAGRLLSPPSGGDALTLPCEGAKQTDDSVQIFGSACG
jgi:hypothetical protein